MFFRVDSLRLFLGPVMVGLTIIILGYSSTLKSFLVVTILPKPYNSISGNWQSTHSFYLELVFNPPCRPD